MSSLEWQYLRDSTHPVVQDATGAFLCGMKQQTGFASGSLDHTDFMQARYATCASTLEQVANVDCQNVLGHGHNPLGWFAVQTKACYLEVSLAPANTPPKHEFMHCWVNEQGPDMSADRQEQRCLLLCTDRALP